MDAIFGELLRLPCWYCKYSNSYHSGCIKRQSDVIEDGCQRSKCERMAPDLEQIQLGMKAYFEYLDALKSK